MQQGQITGKRRNTEESTELDVNIRRRLASYQSITPPKNCNDEASIHTCCVLGNNQAEIQLREQYNAETRYSAKMLDENLFVGVFSSSANSVLKKLRFGEHEFSDYLIAIHHSKRVILERKARFDTGFSKCNLAHFEYLHARFGYTTLNHIETLVNLANRILYLLKHGNRVFLAESASSRSNEAVAAFLLCHRNAYTRNTAMEVLSFLGCKYALDTELLLKRMLVLREIRRGKLFGKLNDDLIGRILEFL